MPELSNLFFESLSQADKEALRPHLRRVHLPHKEVLFEAGGTISGVYLPTGGVVSLIIGLSTGTQIESAMVGREGLIGASSALDGKISLCSAVVQLEGDSLMCEVSAVRGLALQSHTFLAKIIRHEQTLFAQAQQSTACMAEHDVEARLARWLLRARDLSGSDVLIFTQEFLGEMLGVQRSSVTLAASALQQTAIIDYSRGKIKILDREALEEVTCECYAAIKEHHRLLLGGPSSSRLPTSTSSKRRLKTASDAWPTRSSASRCSTFILADHVQPGPRESDRTIQQLLDVLDGEDVVEAVERFEAGHRRCG